MHITPSLHSINILILACLFLIFQLRITVCDNSQYVPSDNIAVNCGATSPGNLSYIGRNWTGDVGSDFIFSTSGNKSVSSKASFMSQPVPEVPYLTARIFHSQFTYNFNVTPGPKFIRFHFYPSSYMGLNASEAFLTVTASAGRYTLLHNFSASLVADYFMVPILMREFIVYASGNTLDITFAPTPNASYGFVNGIEVVSMPLNLYIRGVDVPLPFVGHLPAVISIDKTYGLETCYRINVGGNDIPPQHDTGMFRYWTKDEGYIYGAAFGTTPFDLNITLRYPPELPPYTAPERVYRTARSMGSYSNVNLNYNLSWFFPVDSGFLYLVRLHFCEVYRYVSKTNMRVFDIFINNQTAMLRADVIAWSGGYAVPVYKDFVVMVPEVSKGEKQDLWLELHPNAFSKAQYMNAILNGVEIFKMSDNYGNLAGVNPPKIESVQGLPFVDPSSKSSRNIKKILFITITGCLLGGLLVFLMCLLAFRLKMMKEWVFHYFKRSAMEKTYISPLCRKFSFNEIKAVTSNFDEALVIGVGGFGKVYKGYIAHDATMVAIKRGNPTAEQGLLEFQTEIKMLSQLRHHNIVPLLGYSMVDNEMILVYDYMANGTLYDHLHSNLSPLTWEQRLKICIGAARGLHYLHTGGKHPIIHRDVKATNILLDENYVAKISDFGLSKLGPAASSFNHAISTEVKGSFGYLDPEYYRHLKLTEKSDVYSFGVVLLEVLCAKPAVNPTAEDEHINLVDWALCHYQKDTMDRIVDTHLQGMIASESLVKFVDIAKHCLAERGVERPPMSEVLQNLELVLQLQNGADAGDVPPGLKNKVDADIAPRSMTNSDVTPGVEFSEIMMPCGPIATDTSCHVSSDNILLDCGSSESSSFNGKNWTGDVGSMFLPSNHKITSTTSVVLDSSVPKVPFSTARIFHSPFTYSFPITPGLKLIRLYFYSAPFSGLKPCNAFFSVVSGRFTLLDNFSTSVSADALKSAYFTKDFSVNIKEQKLNITFIPLPAASNSFAFVNGIEIFSLPLNMYVPGGNVSLPFIGPQALFSIQDETAFEILYRVGVKAKIQDSDVFTDWLDDSNYLLSSQSGKPIFSEVLIDVKYNCSGYVAPEDLYMTASTMGSNSHMNMEYNLTWTFAVDSGFTYLIRLHFCEISSEVTEVNQRVFKIYINNQTAENSMDVIALAGAPYLATYRDYAVMVPERAESKYLWLALHPNTESKPKYADAILNGIEIVKLSDGKNNLAAHNPIDFNRTVKKASFRIIIVVSVLGGVAGLSFLCLIAVRLCRRVKWMSPCVHQSHTVHDNRNCSILSVTSSDICRQFLLVEIRAATNNFDEALVIGSGGFGKVYKGFVDGGATKVAVKRGEPKSQQGFREFQNEIELLSKFHHMHLVSLIGYCQESGEMILVYEYMGHGTLRDHLYKSDTPPLPWEQRLKICIGAARGLHHLHTGAKYSIIHRDVKTTNILLDDEWVAKVSDFGLSREGPTTASRGHVSTVVKGTFGYLDPEYYRRRKLTEKSDVYSFGVVLLEVLCGRPAVKAIGVVEECEDDERVCLADWAKHCHQTGTIDRMIDPYLRGKIAPECLSVFVDVAVRCLADKGIERPTMSEMLGRLEHALQLQELSNVKACFADPV
ncbi:hypothetical protein F0562_033898 [Nyssa sinensis]|uniref:Protein kinase domain-containing protein n=1 Tax=Nyssa sinensis TaxID=561372 RepID=A0A5J5AE88_9ASTE|nr:hypothetical protein F0562_033898 [Nyssa sinensis]